MDGQYDLNTLRVDGEIFESGTKKLRIRKYPDTCGQGLSSKTVVFAREFIMIRLGSLERDYSLFRGVNS